MAKGKPVKVRKAEIVKSISSRSDLRERDVRVVIDSFFEEVKSAIGKGCVVELRGFGTFSVKIRKGRSRARNPRTGEEGSVADHGAPSFRPGREMKKIAWPLS